MDNGAPGLQPDTATATTEAAATHGSMAAATDNDWRAALSEDTRKTVDAKGWKGPDDAVKSYTDLFRTYTEVTQKALTLPPADAKAEDWNAFYAKVGRPEQPTGYEFKLPEGLPETFPYDDTNRVKFSTWAHQAGLMPKQAQALHDAYVRDTADRLAAFQQEQSEREAKAHTEIVKEWGDPSSEAYRRNLSLADRAIRQTGGDALLADLKASGLMGGDGAVKSAPLARMLAKIGGELYAEDALYGGINTTVNPFDAKNENLTQQGQVIRSDPERARALIRQAGGNPKEWGL